MESLSRGSRPLALTGLAMAAGSGACMEGPAYGTRDLPTGTPEERALERRMYEQADVARERAEREAAGALGGDGGGDGGGGGGSH